MTNGMEHDKRRVDGNVGDNLSLPDPAKASPTQRLKPGEWIVFPSLAEFVRETVSNPIAPSWPKEREDAAALLQTLTDVVANMHACPRYLDMIRSLMYPHKVQFKADGIIEKVAFLNGAEPDVLDRLKERPLNKWTREELEGIGLPLQSLLLDPVALGQLHHEVHSEYPIAWMPAILEQLDKQVEIEKDDPTVRQVPKISMEVIWDKVFGDGDYQKLKAPQKDPEK